MGNPIDSLFSQRDIFADFFTRYYTDWEPEHCLVTESEGHVVGYLTGCAHNARYAWVQPLIVARVIAPRVVARVLTGRCSRQDRSFLGWFLSKALSETPASPRKAAHFHINLLPAWRNGLASRKMIFSFLDHLRRSRVPRVYGQIQTYGTRRPARVFERYGFQMFDRRRITRFERFCKDEIYVTTFVKTLRPS